MSCVLINTQGDSDNDDDSDNADGEGESEIETAASGILKGHGVRIRHSLNACADS